MARTVVYPAAARRAGKGRSGGARRVLPLLVAAGLATGGCRGSGVCAVTDAAAPADRDPGDARAVDAAADSGAGVAESRLRLRFLGVGGWALRHPAGTVMTAPLYTNPSLPSVMTGTVASSPTAVARFLDPAVAGETVAILVGHAHYDHLMDVPEVWQRTPGAMIYGTTSAGHLLAAFADDLAPGCPARPAARPVVPRDHVVTVDAPGADLVDRRMCPGQVTCAGERPLQAGAWIAVPGSRIRVRALCSSHPPQFLDVAFAVGCVTADQCDPPAHAADWLGGDTIAYLVDVLDAATGEPRFRVYFQDAPTGAPVGFVHVDLLAEKRVDVAILNVANFDQVANDPTAIIAELDPRYVLGSHWENFFQQQDQPLEPVPLLAPPDGFVALAETALAAGGEAAMMVDGVPQDRRFWLPAPGTEIEIEAAPGN